MNCHLSQISCRSCYLYSKMPPFGLFPSVSQYPQPREYWDLCMRNTSHNFLVLIEESTPDNIS